ncbi:hypothetical protein CPAR01_00839 [Colletotrichum paranaense]|uniref:Uncharacterized protein n=1 Tax=Colletotrichum paranaense TaxID=1914294 RepID=A0ABQ9T507_9PEZI|nr:uncharacterized protein CPAR01_00839 [Colletotrichum paranaense]KAK1546872.1 hypothetical protein CPAR01_00839 [Colletotrichum paranaense]
MTTDTLRSQGSVNPQRSGDKIVSVGSSQEPQTASPVEPWRAELEEQIVNLESWGDEQETEIASIILKMLLSFPEKGYLATLEASLRIGADYWAKFLPSSWDPLNKPYMKDDKGWPMYLAGVYGTISYQSWLLRYDDPRQDCLVHLLIDLQNLPKVTYRSYGEEHHAYHNDPVFTSMCNENWSAKFASDRPEPTEPEAKKDFILTCDEWVNFSSFLARYHGSKAYQPRPGALKYPSVDIELALEKPLPPGKLGECRLLVASNWFIHAGKLIYENMAETDTKNWNLGVWTLWTKAIRDILQAGGQSNEVTTRLQAALDMVVSLTPKGSETKGSSELGESSEAQKKSKIQESSKVKNSSEAQDNGEVKETGEVKESGEAKESSEAQESSEVKEDSDTK